MSDHEGDSTADPLTATRAADVSAVTISLKLPVFWPSDPEIWFAQVEAQFACKRITTQWTKLDHVIASLTPEYAAEVRVLVLKPPTDCPYDVLKEQLTTAYEQRRFQQLFTAEELGDLISSLGECSSS